MPPQLAINGIDLSGYLALDDGWRRLADIEIGGRDRAFGGGARNAVRAKKRAVQLRTVPRSQAEAEALRGLLQGDGDTWSWDSSLYSAKGRPILSGSAALSGGVIKHGALGLSVTGQVRWDVGNPIVSGSYLTGYTVFGWRDIGGGLVHHFLFSRDPGSAVRLYYTNGVVSSNLDVFAGYDWFGVGSEGGLYFNAPGLSAAAWTATTAKVLGNRVKPASSAYAFRAETAGTTGAVEPDWALVPFRSTVVDGSVTWRNIGPATLGVDDFVYWPFVVPTSWPSAIYAEHNARAWTAQPRLRVTGDLVPNAPWTMDGKFDGSRNVPIASGTGLSVTHEALDFTLEES